VDWRPSKADKTIAANGRKALNTHLHLLESLTTLYTATGDQRVRRRVEELLNLFATKIVDPRRGFARTFFNNDWSPADAVTSSYGHDIELSWLMTETAEELGGPVLDNQRRLSLALVDHTLRYGFDRANGGVFDEGPAGGSPTSMRMNWWVQAEALIGLLNAYQLSGQPKYWQAFEQQAKYTLDHFVDREYGEWHNTILPDGRITGPKASDWKGPYHAGRACMEVVRRLQRMREAPGG
jgi:mannobiose 2-epimerase